MVKDLPFRVNLQGEPRWQKEQKERKNKKQHRVVVWWLFVIGFLLVGGLVVKTIQMFTTSLWDGESRINFALAAEAVTLASFSPQEEELILLVIPQNTQIEVTHGYGKYRVGAIASLADLEKRQGLLAESLQENFGIPVEGMVNSKLKIVKSKEELLKELRNQILNPERTNLSQWDLVRFWWQVKKVRFDHVKVLDLSKISVLLSRTLPDQTSVWEIDKASFDSRLAKLFSEPKIREENLGIEVLNGTVHPGLAEKGARILSNMGGEVGWVGNSELQIANCKLQIDKKTKNSYTVKKIQKIFGCQLEEKKEEGRAEITLILGEDYWQKLNQK